jgi:hypothetical protein
MDPKNNANPVAPDDEQKTTGVDTPQDIMAGLGNETPTTDGTSTEAPVVPPTSEPTADPNKLPDDMAVNTTPDSTAPTMDTQPSIASEEPAAPVGSSVTPDNMPPADGMPPMPTDTSSVTPGADASVPPTAPTPVPNNDKKTIMVLGVVAVVLLAAIAVLYFVV